VFFPPVVISVGFGSALALVGSVQYLNAELKLDPEFAAGLETDTCFRP
jgi:hypothetical protein